MIYEHFSYSVYSAFMVYAFLFPLLGGCVYLRFRFYLTTSGKVKSPDSLSLSIHTAGISFLTVGSLIKGILDIYGTTNKLNLFYWIFGIILIIIELSISLRKELR